MPLFSKDFEVFSETKKKVFTIQRADFDNIFTLRDIICTLLTFQSDLDGLPEVLGRRSHCPPLPPSRRP